MSKEGEEEKGNNIGSGGPGGRIMGYGTFQGYPSHPPPVAVSVGGFPQPVPPQPQLQYPSSPYHPLPPIYYAHGYQAIPVAEGRPLSLRTERLPFCGLGIGWFLFIIGFFFGGIPWYVGALILLFVRIDYREKPGLVACTIAAVVAAIAVTFGLTNKGS
ncbi:60S ribosomal protein L18a-like protein isoform X1 [Iris pallida]|uniref:60S ribosomal protein L18a-like protein isoform X1 n=1 Tax=Iris pallida TaxID=29817 RepID=A0AAX6HNG6_IRIPA|nr:60S ribosomal protein L18a-like protein isoform X1 [Iris pallida]